MSVTSENVVITKTARRKLVRAKAGAQDLPKIIGVAFGDGGVDEEGTIIPPDEDQTELRHELHRKQIDGYEFVNDTTCRYRCTLIENELSGEEISEVGLYDEDGDIVEIKAFMRKGKDPDIRQTFTIDDVM